MPEGSKAGDVRRRTEGVVVKTRIVRVIAAGLAVFALAIGGTSVGEQHTNEAHTADTGWG